MMDPLTTQTADKNYGGRASGMGGPPMPGDNMPGAGSATIKCPHCGQDIELNASKPVAEMPEVGRFANAGKPAGGSMDESEVLGGAGPGGM